MEYIINKYYKKMKRLVLLFAMLLIVLSATCQKDKVFTTLTTFEQGIKFGDGTIQTTAATGSGIVSWESITNKPLTFPPSTHNHDALYRPITWVPTFAQITSKPTTLSGYGITDAATSTHNHNTLYKPLSYVPTWSEITSKPTFATVAITGSYNDLNNKPATEELADAMASLPGFKIPVLTQTQINALTPVKGLLLYNSTDNVLQIYTGSVWKIIISAN